MTDTEITDQRHVSPLTGFILKRTVDCDLISILFCTCDAIVTEGVDRLHHFGYITFIPMCLGNITRFQIANKLPAAVSGISTVMCP